ncbi:MAG: TolC family protein [Acidovorax sp.]
MNVKPVLVLLWALFMECGLALAQSPLHTEPEALGRSLRVHLPPDLLASSGPGEPADPGNADGLQSLDLDCATRASASSADNPQWALQTLQASSHATPSVLHLPIAVQLAVCHNPQLRASWSQIAQQAAQAGQAQSAYWPQLNASVARQRSRVGYADADIPASQTQVTAQNVILSWRLWDFGARSARVDAAQAQVRAALSGQNAVLHKAVADVLHIYAEAQSAQARLATQRQLQPLASRNLQAVKRRQAAGAGSAGDILQAITAQARIQLEQSRAEGDLRKALAQLIYQVGLPPGTALEVSSLLPESTLEVTGQLSPTAEITTEKAVPHPAVPLLSLTTQRLLNQTLNDWLAHARQYHPAVEAARAQLQAAEASLKAIRADGLPTLDLSLGHYRNGRPNMALSAVHSRENVVGISLAIPLFDGFANTYKANAAQALMEQRLVELQATEQQTLQEVVQLHAEAHASLNNLKAAADLYRAAQAAVQSVQRQYEKGALDVLQLNQGLITLQQAQYELTRAQLEWSRARLRLWLVEMPRGRA